MAERSIAAVLKTAGPQGPGGSNPSLSAIFPRPFRTVNALPSPAPPRGRAGSVVPSLLLLLTAVIWGAAFVAQRLGMDHVGPWAFGVARNLLGFLALLPVIAWRRRALGLRPAKGGFRALAFASLACGAALFAASMCQQVGLQWTSAGLSGFLTANYVLLVPVLGCLVGRPPLRTTWVGVALALAGLYFISVGPDASIAVGRGEALTLLCALLFAVQILCVDRFAPDLDPVALAAGEFLVSFLAGLPFLLLPSESARLSAASLRAALPAIAFAGLLSSGVAYTLQIVAQRRTRPAIASILMSLEAVFAALFGWLFLRQALAPRQIAGCALVFAAVVFVQLAAARAPRA